MIQSSTVIADNLESFLYIGALFAWGYLSLVLIEVVICKDARTIDTAKLLSKPLNLRLRLFRRSLRSSFYRISVGLLVASFMAVLLLMNNLWNNQPKRLPWVLFHDILATSLIYLYAYLGHGVIFFVKLRHFLKGT